ncbi:MAG TPA: hypothetical protein VIU81_02755 [Gaiellaceae bacterium]
MEGAAPRFLWRELGQVLLEENLITEDELEQALREQARSGRLLGQIIVANGYLSAFTLARVLSEQHGVRLSATAAAEAEVEGAVKGDDPPLVLADPPELGADRPWRPLGKVLLDQGVLTEDQLGEALTRQEENRGRLGEILVSGGLVSGAQLAGALAEQHGLGLEPEPELEAAVVPMSPGEPVYKVFEVHFEPGRERRIALYENPNFLEAADFAFEYVEGHEPDALEIHRLEGDHQETVWNYSATRAAAVNAGRKDLAETFGFDPTRWGREL